MNDKAAATRSWQDFLLERFAKQTYDELIKIENGTILEPPENYSDVKFWVDVSVSSGDDENTPKGTVCIRVYSDFRAGLLIYAPFIEVAPNGQILDPLRDWEGD